jgi:hypothetical protein
MNCFHLGGRAFHSRSLPPTQKGRAALNKPPAGERHAKKANLLQRSRHLHTSAFHSRTRPRPAHSSGASHAHHTCALFHVFDTRATHARALLPAALASVPFGFVSVRVRVRVPKAPRSFLGLVAYANFPFTPPAPLPFTCLLHATRRVLPFLPEVVASVSYGFVLVRVRVRTLPSAFYEEAARAQACTASPKHPNLACLVSPCMNEAGATLGKNVSVLIGREAGR